MPSSLTSWAAVPWDDASQSSTSFACTGTRNCSSSSFVHICKSKKVKWDVDSRISYFRHLLVIMQYSTVATGDRSSIQSDAD